MPPTRERITIATLLLAAILAATTSACAAGAPGGATSRFPASNAATPATEPRTPLATDARVLAVLLRELEADRLTRRERIAVHVADGIVTLRGELGNHAAHERALAIARVVRNTRAVVDRTTERPGQMTDSDAEFEIACALARDPITRAQPIAGSAHDGIVRLTGSVDSNVARRAAETDAATVSGTREVVDNLVETAVPHRSDWLVLLEAERALRDDEALDASRVHASAFRGVVTLRGSVGSWSAVARVAADARAASPAGVDATPLRVEPAADDGTRRSRPPFQPSDTSVAQALVDAFARDPRLHAFLPELDVRYGVVALTGLAPTLEVKRAASDDARNVVGVRAVHDDLNVAESATASDEAILRAAVSAIERDPELGVRHLRVDVWNGRLLVRGGVASETDRLRAVAVTTSVPGVRSVEDALFVLPLTFRQARR
jgi:osmotically-inducible protein OsmY